MLNYVPTVNGCLPSYMKRSFLSDVESRSSKSKFWRLLLSIKLRYFFRVYPVLLTELIQLHEIDIPIPYFIM